MLLYQIHTDKRITVTKHQFFASRGSKRCCETLIMLILCAAAPMEVAQPSEVEQSVAVDNGAYISDAAVCSIEVT